MSKKVTRPPGFALRWLEWFCPPSLHESVVGDLTEQFDGDVDEAGEVKAKFKFVWNVIRFFRPAIILRNRFSLNLNAISMLQSYFKITFRQLARNKGFAFINVFGLAIGIAVTILIVQYVKFESSYDKFNASAGQIYRVTHERFLYGKQQYEKAQAFVPTGEIMKSEFPEIQEFTTLFKLSDQSEVAVSYRNELGDAVVFREDNIYSVRGNFFNVFSLSFVEGDRRMKSLEPKTVVISESAAGRYFPGISPLNKIIGHTYTGGYRIVGVFKDLPENSHLKFNFLFSWEAISPNDLENWRWDGFFTYLKLAPMTDVIALENKFPDFVKKYLSQRSDITGDSKFHLQSLLDIHLNSHLTGEAEPNGDANTITIFKILALFILAIAYINYINLSTARSLDRAKEIGIRKVIGSGRGELITQFLLESFIINTIAAVMALSIVCFFVVPFGDFFGIRTSLELFKEPGFWLTFVSILVAGSILAGLYHAFMMSSFKPVKVLKGKIEMGGRGFFISLRRSMVTFQFALSIFMIAGSVLIYKQVDYMKTRNMGIDINQVLVLRTFIKFGPPGSDSVFMNKLGLLKHQLSGFSNVRNVTASADVPGREHLALFSHFRKVRDSKEHVSVYYSRVDYDFMPAFNAKFIAGRNFSEESIADEDAIVVNKEALRILGFDKAEDAIGHDVFFGREPQIAAVRIIGVVDFRSTSFKEKNFPVAYQLTWSPLRYLSIKLEQAKGGDMHSNLEEIKRAWVKMFPDSPFDYFFLDDLFNKQYQEDQKLSKTLILFTGLAIFIACLGLYGLSSLVVSQRTKEIGVRKILGASVKNLLILLSRDFVIMVIVAGLISFPLIWFSLSKWLEQYPFRTDVPWWIFAGPPVLMLLIALITVGRKTLNAALSNPVESLKYE